MTARPMRRPRTGSEGGDGVITIGELAAAAGVSVSTVSRALRGLPDVSAPTRKRIRDLAAELGYVPSAHAAGLASGRAMAINVVVPTVRGWFTGAVLDGIDEVLRDADYDIVLYNVGGGGRFRHDVFRRSILRRRGDAVIGVCLDFSEEERAQLRRAGLPAVVVGPVDGMPWTGIDEVEVGRSATEHLIERGHRDILHVTGGREQVLHLNPRVPSGRAEGYAAAMRGAGLEVHEESILRGSFTIEGSHTVVNEYLHASPALPTAVFAASDEMAIGAMLAARDHGLAVPRDLSIVGIDDHPLAAVVGLTTFRQDPQGQGEMAARALLGELDHGIPVSSPTVLPTTLIERTSVALPRVPS